MRFEVLRQVQPAPTKIFFSFCNVILQLRIMDGLEDTHFFLHYYCWPLISIILSTAVFKRIEGFYTICTSFSLSWWARTHCIILSFGLDAGSPLPIAQIRSGRSSAAFSEDGRLEGDIVHIDVGFSDGRAGEGLGLFWDGSKKEGAQKTWIAWEGNQERAVSLRTAFLWTAEKAGQFSTRKAIKDIFSR
jgi:hypothetical protein